MTAPAAPGCSAVEAARDAVLAVAEPVGHGARRRRRFARPDHRRDRDARASPFRRGPTRRWTAMRSGAPTPPGPPRTHPWSSGSSATCAAGAAPDVTVVPGTAVRIATGARLPDGADAVVPVEDTTPLDAAGRPGPRGRDATGPVPAACLVHVAAGPGDSVRAAGSDLGAGQAILAPGTPISAAAVTLIAGTGVDGRRWSIGGRGSRSLPPATRSGRRASRSARPGSPTPTAPACAPTSPPPAPSRSTSGSPSTTSTTCSARLRRGLAEGADALIVSGGVSVGPYDVVKTAIEAIGRIDLWRVAVQPGKPFAFGVADRPGGGTPVLLFGLPGNPVSSAVTFELFVRPAIRALAGRTDLLRPVDRAVLGEPVSKSHGRRAFLRVQADRDADGAPSATPAGASGPPRGRAGEPRHLGPRRGRCPGRHPGGRRHAAGRRRGRALVARHRMMASPPDPTARPGGPDGIQTAATRRTAAALPRRSARAGRGWSTCRPSR